MLYRTRFVAALAALPLAFAPLAALAQTATQTDATAANPTGLSSCFDYYKFGSVPAVIQSSLSAVAQSATIAFKGTVTNQNAYPIVDATVYVKIFHERSTGKDVNGPDVVDWFPVVKDVTLKAGETLPLSFTWVVPPNAMLGEYQAATFVVASDRFEMSGLSFTDDVTGNATDFKVVGNDAGIVQFDKAGVSIAGQPYQFAAFAPVVASGTPITLTAAVDNTTKQSFTGTVKWSIYYWDSLQSSHLLDSSTNNVSVGAMSSSTASFTITDTSHSVYYVVGEIDTPMGAKSIIGARFVRDGIDTPRFNFVGLSSYPITNGETYAVACVHSAGTNAAPDSKVVVSVSPIASSWFSGLFGSGPIATKTYEGSIPGAVNAVIVPITAGGGADSYELTAMLYQSGALVDSVSVDYRCEDLGTCTATSSSGSWILIVVSLILFIAIVWAVVRFLRSRKNESSTYTPTL